MKLGEDIAGIHGYLCGDGYVIRNPETQKHKYYVIGFRNQNRTLLEDFQRKFMRIFGAMPTIRKDGRCVKNSKEIYEKITKHWSFYSDKWELPTTSTKQKRIWIRAFFDCEAWVESEGRKNRRIGLDSINEMGILQIQEALKIIGITSSVKKNKGKDTFRLQIFGKDNLDRYARRIGFLHPEKNERLKNALDSYPNYVWVFPKIRRELKDFIKRIMLKKARVRKPFYIRLVNNRIENLKMLSFCLEDIFGIQSTFHESRSGQGTKYYELSISRKESVNKVIKHGLINREALKIWRVSNERGASEGEQFRMASSQIRQEGDEGGCENNCEYENNECNRRGRYSTIDECRLSSRSC